MSPFLTKNSLKLALKIFSQIYCRMDQPIKAINYYQEGLQCYENDPTLLTGLARTREVKISPKPIK